MKRKFEKKLYALELVQEAFLSHMNSLSRENLRGGGNNNYTLGFISTFNNKYRSVSKIIKKNYNILMLDQRLAPVLTAALQVSFRKAPNMKNILAPIKIQKESTRSLLDIRTEQAFFNVKKEDV